MSARPIPPGLATATAPGLVPALAAGQSPQGSAGAVVAYDRCPAAITWAALLVLGASATHAGKVLALTTYVGEDTATHTRGVDWTGDIFVECLLDAAGAWVWRPIGNSRVACIDWYRPAAHAWLVGLVCQLTDGPTERVVYAMDTAATWVLRGSNASADQAGYTDTLGYGLMQKVNDNTSALMATANTGGVMIFATRVANAAQSVLLQRSLVGWTRGMAIATNIVGGLDSVDIALAVGGAPSYRTPYAAGTIAGVGRYCLAWANLGGNPPVMHLSLNGGGMVVSTFAAGVETEVNVGDFLIIGSNSDGSSPIYRHAVMAVKLFSTLPTDANLQLYSGTFGGTVVRTRGVIPLAAGDTESWSWNARHFSQMAGEHSYSEQLSLNVYRATTVVPGTRRIIVP